MSNYMVTKKVDISELKIGMYVSRLEVPWSATEFPLKGVLVTSKQDIIKLARYGRTFFIDQNKSLNASPQKLIAEVFSKQSQGKNKKAPRTWRKFCTSNYQTNAPISKEIVQAKKLLNRVDAVFESMKTDIQQLGPSNVSQIKMASNSMVESIIDNPDALLWLIKVKDDSGKVFDHTVRAAVWAISLGRSMGVQKSSLATMTQAILLSGIGKSFLKKQDWIKYNGANLSPSFARWVNITLHQLSQCNVEPRVLTIIANMAERYDGSGFSDGKASNAIPYLSQMASLAESFDIILHPMLGRKKRHFANALARLYCLSDKLFDRALIEEFIQATGLYPAGTQVILSDGSRGVVVEQSKQRRLRATVAITHDKDGYRMLSYNVVRLGEGKFEKVIVKQEAPSLDLNQEDLERINLLIQKHQQSLVGSLVSGFAGMFAS